MIKITEIIKLSKISDNYRVIDFQIIKKIKNQVVFFNNYFAKLSLKKIKNSPTFQKKVWI